MSAESFARALREKARLEEFPHDEHGRPAAFVCGVGFCAFGDADLRKSLLRVADMIEEKEMEYAKTCGKCHWFARWRPWSRDGVCFEEDVELESGFVNRCAAAGDAACSQFMDAEKWAPGPDERARVARGLRDLATGRDAPEDLLGELCGMFGVAGWRALALKMSEMCGEPTCSYVRDATGPAGNAFERCDRCGQQLDARLLDGSATCNYAYCPSCGRRIAGFDR